MKNQMKYPMVAITTIVTAKETIAPGAVFDAGSSKEAKLLRAAGAAENYTEPQQDAHQSPPASGEGGSAPAQEEALLIEQITQAQTVDESTALVGESEERPAVREAFAARMDQLHA